MTAKRDFSQHPQEGREEVFGNMEEALNDMEGYIPSARQKQPYWKSFVFKRLEFKDLAFSNGWMDHAFEFPAIEDCLESAVKEVGTVARIALLDPSLQIEVVRVDGGDCPTWACQVHRYEWIKRFVEVRPATRILLVLSQPAIERLPKEEVMEDLRHELGHVFLLLRDAKDDCDAADEEWKRCTQLEDFIVRITVEFS